MLRSYRVVLERYEDLNWKKVLGFTSIATFVTFSWLLPVQAASFDCTGALTEAEATICADDELSTFDRIMGILWGEQNAPSAAMLERQREWLESRDLCGSSVDCLQQSYLDRLADEPFYLRSFEVTELYDLQTEEFGQYLFANTHYAYNVETFVFALGDDERFAIPWIKPQFSEEVETCGLRVLPDFDWEFELSLSELGWLNVLDQGYREREVQAGEISVFTKWIGHGDLSSEVFYRLIDGRFVPDRALIDNCEDQTQEFTAIFFDNPEGKVEELRTNSVTSELQLEGELFDDYDARVQQCEKAPNMGAIRMCLMGATDARMQAAFEARRLFLYEAVSSDALDRLNETQTAFENYRSSSCGLILDINYGWIADDFAMNCYNRLTNQRTEFLNTQWLPD